MRRIFQKVPLTSFYILILFGPKHPILEAFCVYMKKQFWPKNNEKPFKNTFII